MTSSFATCLKLSLSPGDAEREQASIPGQGTEGIPSSSRSQLSLEAWGTVLQKAFGKHKSLSHGWMESQFTPFFYRRLSVLKWLI